MRTRAQNSKKDGPKHASYLATLDEQLIKFNKNMGLLSAKINKNGIDSEACKMVGKEILSLTNMCGNISAANIGKDILDKIILEFRARSHHLFLESPCIKRSYQKPRGYAGDFEIIDRIYQNVPAGEGIGRAIDAYYLGTPGSKAMRSRKKLCVKEISKYLNKKSETKAKIGLLDLGCGPGRDIFEIAESLPPGNKVNYLLIDQDEEALKYCQRVLSAHKEKIKFEKTNLLKIIAGEKYAAKRYGTFDVIMCIGLYDYIDKKGSVKLTRSIYSMLNEGGMAIISNWDVSNPSRAELEWVCDWYLFHRTENDMNGIALDAGIPQEQIKTTKESTGHFNLVFIEKNAKHE